MKNVMIDGHRLGQNEPTYFVADIAANHNGNLETAKRLIELAKKSGADAAKFQHFQAEKIVSRYGFEHLGDKKSHQAKWKKSVYEVYQEASLPWEWTQMLADHAKKVGIAFFSAPYDLRVVDLLDPLVPAYKIGSGDITWLEINKKIAAKKKPVFLATGASNIGEVQEAVTTILKLNQELVLMQCNTNYTGSTENFHCISLNVLKTYRAMYPDLILGLSDHTPGCATVLGAVALGARVIEKHFTENKSQEGPDHPFSMDPNDWREMVDRTRELESALGRTEKKVEDNERETVIFQRRCLRASRPLQAEATISKEDIDVLRPAQPGALLPKEIELIIGYRLQTSMEKGQHFTWSCFTEQFAASECQ